MTRDRRSRGPRRSLVTTSPRSKATEEFNSAAAFIVDWLAELGCQPTRFEYRGLTGWKATCPLYESRIAGWVPPEWALDLWPPVCANITIRSSEDGQALIGAFPCDGCSLGDIIARLLGVTEDDPAVWKAARKGGAR